MNANLAKIAFVYAKTAYLAHNNAPKVPSSPIGHRESGFLALVVGQYTKTI